jgi:hypothetical protein
MVAFLSFVVLMGYSKHVVCTIPVRTIRWARLL